MKYKKNRSSGKTLGAAPLNRSD